MHYTVHPEIFTVEIFIDGNEIPFVHQPQQVNGEPWASKDQAEAWAEAVIAHHADPEKNEFPL